MTYRDGANGLLTWVSNRHVERWKIQNFGRSTEKFIKPHRLLTHGGKGAADACTIHPVNIYQATTKHWVSFYHAERPSPGRKKCGGGYLGLRYTIHRMESHDGGKTWTKTGPAITQNTNLLNDRATDDTGSPRLVVRGDYMYLLYSTAGKRKGEVKRFTSLARAPLSTLGASGTWKKYFKGAFTEPGLGGNQSKVTWARRGIAYNTYLNAYISVAVHNDGMKIYTSEDLLHWSLLAYPWDTGRSGNVFGDKCDPAVGMDRQLGYGGIVGLNGDDTTSAKSFWAYYMNKPDGKCFDHRLLQRRRVTLTADNPPAPLKAPSFTLPASRSMRVGNSGSIPVTTTGGDGAYYTVKAYNNTHPHVVRATITGRDADHALKLTALRAGRSTVTVTATSAGRTTTKTIVVRVTDKVHFTGFRRPHGTTVDRNATGPKGTYVFKVRVLDSQDRPVTVGKVRLVDSRGNRVAAGIRPNAQGWVTFRINPANKAKPRKVRALIQYLGAHGYLAKKGTKAFPFTIVK
ncbi:MAG: hypothetical protein J2P22_05435 [Nocardioides sp.]|nr:hypothetical protein [Nocardioides sp.]